MRGTRRAALAAALAGLCGAGTVLAQSADVPYQTTVELPPQILTVDQDRLFAESAFGKRVGTEVELRSRDLATENRRLETDLETEERALTEARPGLDADEFRARADAFDAKVQRIREEQDAKARALGAFRDAERTRFAELLARVLVEVARDRGALAVLDRRVMIISADAIDATDAAIAAVDRAVGDGSGQAGDLPELDPSAPSGNGPSGDSAPEPQSTGSETPAEDPQGGAGAAAADGTEPSIPNPPAAAGD